MCFAQSQNSLRGGRLFGLMAQIMRILFVQNRLLFPPNTGGRIRTLNVLRYLAMWHEVTYLCNVSSAGGEDEHTDSMRALGVRLETVPWDMVTNRQWRFYWHLAWNQFSRRPFSVAKDFNPGLRARAAQLLAESTFDLVICDFVQLAPCVIGLHCPASLLFQHNVEAQIFERHAASDCGWLRRRIMAAEWRKMQRFEAENGRWFDAVIAVSEPDKAVFEAEYGWKHVHVIDTAVNVDYFTPAVVAERPGRIVFVASMDWLPNQDGARYFVEQVWLRIRATHPEATFQIVGRNPPPAIKRLGQVDGVEVRGTVPDVRPYFAQAAVVVVPLLVGGGTRIKIFEAMAMGKPVVSTTVGAEGLKVTAGEHLLLADAPQELADAIQSLLGNADRRARLGRAARELVCRSFSAESVARQFEKTCQEIVDVAHSTTVAVTSSESSIGRKS